MASRTRKLAFGAAAVVVIAGGLCAAFVGGVVGEVLTVVLLSAGLAGALLLVFLEVGLGEERELARDRARLRRRKLRALSARRAIRPRSRRRPQ